MDVIVTKKLFELKPHLHNEEIFGDPRKVPEYADIKQSIQATGLQEPIVIKADGTILSGHLRYCALMEIASERGQYSHEVDVLVRVHPDFQSTEKELEYLFAANIQRRQLSPRQIAHAYKSMLATVEAQPKPPRRKRGEGGPKRRPEVRERVARLFNVSVRNAENLAVIFQTAGVPADVHEMVDAKAVSVKAAAEAVKFAIEEAKRRDPGGPIVVSPADVRSHLTYPKTPSGLKWADIVRGAKPEPEEPILIDGVPVKGYYGKVETSDIPPPYLPKQTVKDMLLNGVAYSDRDSSDPGLPLHEAVHRLRARLVESFTHAHNIQEERVAEALEPMLERVAHYLRSMGREVTVVTGDQPGAKTLPTSLYEKLVLFRVILEEDDPDCDPSVLRTILTDIARTAQEKASSIRREQRAIPAKPTTAAVIPRKERPTFSTDIEFIIHAIGQDVVDFLGSDPS